MLAICLLPDLVSVILLKIPYFTSTFYRLKVFRLTRLFTGRINLSGLRFLLAIIFSLAKETSPIISKIVWDVIIKNGWFFVRPFEVFRGLSRSPMLIILVTSITSNYHVFAVNWSGAVRPKKLGNVSGEQFGAGPFHREIWWRRFYLITCVRLYTDLDVKFGKQQE
jgi:hypothetical protein